MKEREKLTFDSQKEDVISIMSEQSELIKQNKDIVSTILNWELKCLITYRKNQIVSLARESFNWEFATALRNSIEYVIPEIVQFSDFTKYAGVQLTEITILSVKKMEMVLDWLKSVNVDKEFTAKVEEFCKMTFSGHSFWSIDEIHSFLFRKSRKPMEEGLEYITD